MWPGAVHEAVAAFDRRVKSAGWDGNRDACREAPPVLDRPSRSARKSVISVLPFEISL